MKGETNPQSSREFIKAVKWIPVIMKLAIMFLLLIILSPFILPWIAYRDASFKSSLKKGMRSAGADEQSVKELSGAFPGIYRMAMSLKNK